MKTSKEKASCWRGCEALRQAVGCGCAPAVGPADLQHSASISLESAGFTGFDKGQLPERAISRQWSDSDNRWIPIERQVLRTSNQLAAADS